MRTLVLVLGATGPPYPALIREEKRTWAARDVEGVDILFYYGGSAVARHGRDLFLAAPDDYWSVGLKTIACFEYVLAHCEFDLVLRTNCSTYVDLPNMQAWAREHASPSRFYAGAIGSVTPQEAIRVRRGGSANPDAAPTEPTGWTFALGSGLFLSRDLVELVVERQADWDHGYQDSTALGKLLAGHGVTPTAIPRVIVESPRRPCAIDTSQFLFRCKTDTAWRRGDLELLRRVDNAFASVRGELVPRWYTPVRRLKTVARRLLPSRR